MRPRACPALALTLLALAVATTAGADTPPPAVDREAAYQALLAQAKAGAPNVDWQALRIAYAERPSFRVFAQSAAKRDMFQAAGRSDCAAALPAARAVIAERYIDADAHMVAAFCEENAGDAVAAALDRDIGRGLIGSIETGDGLSPAAAFTVIDVDEEYSVMRALGLHVTQQALQRADGHAYDALTTSDETGQSATYYFLIDRVLAAEAAALMPGSVSEGGPPDRTP
jgi:hypothetical protein